MTTQLQLINIIIIIIIITIIIIIINGNSVMTVCCSVICYRLFGRDFCVHVLESRRETVQPTQRPALQDDAVTTSDHAVKRDSTL